MQIYIIICEAIIFFSCFGNRPLILIVFYALSPSAATESWKRIQLIVVRVTVAVLFFTCRTMQYQCDTGHARLD